MEGGGGAGVVGTAMVPPLLVLPPAALIRLPLLERRAAARAAAAIVGEVIGGAGSATGATRAGCSAVAGGRVGAGMEGIARCGEVVEIFLAAGGGFATGELDADAEGDEVAVDEGIVMAALEP